MSHFGCACGHVISDVRCPCPCTGHLHGDEDRDTSEAKEEQILSAFVDAILTGSRDAWVRGFFGAEYPLDLSNGAVITDVVLFTRVPYGRSVMECEACGRIHIQAAPNSDQYLSFCPEDRRYHNILRGTQT